MSIDTEDLFERLINEHYAITLYSDIVIELSNEENKLPSKFEVDKFIIDCIQKLNTDSKRLTKDEKSIYFEKTKEECSKEYGGIRKFYFERINPDRILEEFPEYKAKREFHLSSEQYQIIEDKYSLNKVFLQVKTAIHKTLNQLTNKEFGTKYGTIFAKEGFKLFEYIMDNYIPFTRGWQSNISFYYWKMCDDNYIHQRPEKFKDWFENKYQEGSEKVNFINKIKTLEQVSTPNRKTNYATALKLFQQQK